MMNTIKLSKSEIKRHILLAAEDDGRYVLGVPPERDRYEIRWVKSDESVWDAFLTSWFVREIPVVFTSPNVAEVEAGRFLSGHAIPLTEIDQAGLLATVDELLPVEWDRFTNLQQEALTTEFLFSCNLVSGARPTWGREWDAREQEYLPLPAPAKFQWMVVGGAR
jgi:hypothetical protein